MVQGCLEWQKHGLQVPKKVRAETEAYRIESDPLAEFVEDECITGPGYKVQGGEFYKAYVAWAGEQGMRDRELLNIHTFGRRMGERFKKVHTEGGKKYLGIGLKARADG